MNGYRVNNRPRARIRPQRGGFAASLCRPSNLCLEKCLKIDRPRNYRGSRIFSKKQTQVMLQQCSAAEDLIYRRLAPNGPSGARMRARGARMRRLCALHVTIVVNKSRRMALIARRLMEGGRVRAARVTVRGSLHERTELSMPVNSTGTSDGPGNARSGPSLDVRLRQCRR